jgi:hypothetical protein
VRRKAELRTTSDANMNIGSANRELSPDVLVALQEKFAGDERNEVANILREFHWKLRPRWTSAST